MIIIFNRIRLRGELKTHNPYNSEAAREVLRVVLFPSLVLEARRGITEGPDAWGAGVSRAVPGLDMWSLVQPLALRCLGATGICIWLVA